MIFKPAVARPINKMSLTDAHSKISSKPAFGLLELFVFLIVGLSLCLAGCGEEKIKLRPGPILGDVIKNWPNEKEKNSKAREQIKPIVEERHQDQVQRQALQAIVNEVEISDSDLVKFDDQELSFQVIRDWKEVDGESISAILIRLNVFNEKSLDQIAYLRSSIRVLRSDDSEFKRFALDLAEDEQSAVTESSPLIIIAEKGIYLDEKISLETRGRELYLIAPKIVINGRLSLQPLQAEVNQSGEAAGDLHLHCVKLQLGPQHSLNLKGGDAGWIYYQEPSEKDLEKLAQASAQRKFDQWVSESSWAEKRARESETRRLEATEVDPALIVQAWQQVYDQLSSKDQQHFKRDLPAAEIIETQKPSITEQIPVFHFDSPGAENQVRVQLNRDFYDLVGGSSGNLYLEAYSMEGSLNYHNEPGRSRSSQLDSRRTNFVANYIFKAEMESELRFDFHLNYWREFSNSSRGGGGEIVEHTVNEFVGNFSSFAQVFSRSKVPFFSAFDSVSPDSHANESYAGRGRLVNFGESPLESWDDETFGLMDARVIEVFSTVSAIVEARKAVLNSSKK